MTADVTPLKKIEDARGSLVVLELGKGLPFPARRAYYIYGTDPDQPRGFHAHKKLDQVFICLKGSCDVALDDGHEKKTVTLSSPDRALRVGPMIWHEMHRLSPDCLFLALASDIYDENDYIRDYADFKRMAAHD